MKFLKTMIKQRLEERRRRKSDPYHSFRRDAGFLAGLFVNVTAGMIASAVFVLSAPAGRAFPETRAAFQYMSDKRISVVPCGTPFGIKLLTEGVVVTDFGAVNGHLSQLSPAQEAGIRKGDVILSVNGSSVNDCETLSEAVRKKPEGCEIKVRRGEQELSFTADALPSGEDGSYRLGMWIKDSAAGIGTMTYYDPDSGGFGGLGHGVSDQASGTVMPLGRGEITAVTVTDVIRGGNGVPGELCGAFISSTRTGKLTLNCEYGVFGFCDTAPILNEPAEVAHPSEVHTGRASILSTTGGMIPEEYEIEIVSIDSAGSPAKDMTIRITDERLLSRTGGIVQGMSGSPVMQDGMLVGAVTHVLVNDPTLGYAVFAEKMIDHSGAAAPAETAEDHSRQASGTSS